MSRPISTRRICGKLPTACYKPVGIPHRELPWVELTLDELEALRLADHEGFYQDEVAERMAVSRATVSRILTSARGKVAEAFVTGKAIRFEGGAVQRHGGRCGPRVCGRGAGRRCQEKRQQQ